MASEYDTAAANFIASTGLTIRKTYLGHRPYFSGDTEQRAVWEIMLERANHRPYTFTFGNSLQDSYLVRDRDSWHRKVDLSRVMSLKGYKEAVAHGGGDIQGYQLVPTKTEPSNYSLLAAIEKDAPSSFEEFCSDYGYDTDSRKALDTYLAVQAQAQAVARLFTADELDALREIN